MPAVEDEEGEGRLAKAQLSRMHLQALAGGRGARQVHAMSIRAALAATLLALCAPDLPAQDASSSGPVAGMRVRVLAPTLDPQPFVGRMVAIGGDSLLLAATGGLATARLPRAVVARVDASDGHDRLGSALRYGGIGLVAGSVLGVIAVRHEAHGNPLVPMAGAFAGAVLGAPIGATIGAILAPERWRTVWTPGDGR